MTSPTGTATHSLATGCSAPHAGGATTSLTPHSSHTLAARRVLVAFVITTNVHALALRNAAKRIMRAAVYDPAAPQGARLVERAAPKPAKRCCRGVVLCEVRSCGANPVDAKYVIGDKFPESWLPWASRRVAGSTPGFDFSGVVIQAPAGSGFAAGDEVFGFAEDPSSLRPWRPLHGSFCEVVNAPLIKYPTNLRSCRGRKPRPRPWSASRPSKPWSSTASQQVNEF